MRFVNLQATSERAGKGQVRQLILRRPINLQSATSPVLALGDADTGLFQSADDVLEFATAGVSRFKVLADGTVAVAGNLVVNGTTTTVNSTTLTVDDKNIELGSVATPSDTTADGGGITLKGATDKTFNWIDSTDAWTSSEHINLASGKTFQLNGTAITSTAAELNLLNGVSGLVQADLTKLAAVDASAAELNYTDGVTSAIQTQMNAKAPIASPIFTGTTNFRGTNIVNIGDTAAADLYMGPNDTNQVVRFSKNSTGDLDILTNAATLHVDADGSMYHTGGNVGIGTASPDRELTVGGVSNCRINIRSTGDASQLQFGDAADSQIGRLYYEHSDNSLRIHVNADERMRIDSSGNVGIGIATPAVPLHVEDAGSVASGTHYHAYLGTNPGFRIGHKSNGSAITSHVMRGDMSLPVQIGSTEADNSDEGLWIIAGGNVGIGDTSPQGKLEINNRNTATGCALFIKGGEDDLSPIAGQYTGLAFGYGGGDTYNNSAIVHEFINSSAGAKLHLCLNTVLNDGTANISDAKLTLSGTNVGIGVTDPDAKLEVFIDSGSIYAGHFKNTNGTAPTLWVEATGNDNNDTGVLKVDVNGSTRFMVSNYDGNVGIGTAAPAEKLELRDGKMRLSSSSASGYECWMEGTGGGHLYFGINIQSTTVPIMILHNNGSLIPGADNTRNLGSSSARWANIYSADLQLSNEGKEGGNEVDGTTGNWTVQEGDENLFVINRKTGKKFKIDITEI
jgi:hypothetical protein